MTRLTLKWFLAVAIVLATPMFVFAQTQVVGTVSISMTAQDPVVTGQPTSGLKSVQTTLDGVNIGPLFQGSGNGPQTFSFQWDSTTTSNGPHTLVATVKDNAGNASQAAMPITVNNAAPDTTPPTIQFLTPQANATVSGKINVTATAVDNIAVANMKLYIQGLQKASSSTGALSYNWNTSPYKHTNVPLVVTAQDLNGNTGSNSIVVHVP